MISLIEPPQIPQIAKKYPPTYDGVYDAGCAPGRDDYGS